MKKLNKDQIEVAVATVAALTTTVSSVIEQTIKHRAIFKKDGISEKEKEICKKACYLKWGSTVVYGAALGDMVRRSIKDMDRVNEELMKEIEEEIRKEMK